MIYSLITSPITENFILEEVEICECQIPQSDF